MQTTLNAAVESYLRVKTLSRGTRNAYLTTLRKWEPWGGDTPIEELRRKDIREFLDWSTNVPSRMKRRIPAALRIKPKSTCVPSFRGLGNRNLLEAPPVFGTNRWCCGFLESVPEGRARLLPSWFFPGKTSSAGASPSLLEQTPRTPVSILPRRPGRCPGRGREHRGG